MYKITGTIIARIKSDWTKNVDKMTDLEKEMIMQTEQELNGKIAKELYTKYGLGIRVHFTDIEISGSHAKIGVEQKRKKGLLGCPFCGATPTIEPWHGGGPSKRMVMCGNEDCEVSPQVTGKTRKEAIAHWNRRVS